MDKEGSQLPPTEQAESRDTELSEEELRIGSIAEDMLWTSMGASGQHLRRKYGTVEAIEWLADAAKYKNTGDGFYDDLLGMIETIIATGNGSHLIVERLREIVEELESGQQSKFRVEKNFLLSPDHLAFWDKDWNLHIAQVRLLDHPGVAEQREDFHVFSPSDLLKISGLSPTLGIHEAEALAQDFRYARTPMIASLLDREFALHLYDVPLPTQLRLMGYLFDAPKEETDRLQRALTIFGPVVLEAFLATENVNENAENIYAIAEKLPEDTARAIFGSYAELIITAEDVEEYILATIGDKNAERSTDIIANTSSIILKKGAELLRQAAEDAREGKIPSSHKLDGTHANTILLLATLRGENSKRKDEGRSPLSLETILGTRILSKNGAELEATERDRLLELYKDHRKRYLPEERDLLENEFVRLLHNENSTFHMLEHENKIISCFRVAMTGNRMFEVGGYNTDDAYRNLGLSTTFFDTKLDELAGKGRVVAKVRYDAESLPHNINENGFVIDGLIDIVGVPYYRLRRDNARPPNTRAVYTLIAPSPYELKKHFQKGACVIRIVPSPTAGGATSFILAPRSEEVPR